jgi:hypothetical protein
MIQATRQKVAAAIREAHSVHLTPHGGFLPSTTPLKVVSAPFQRYVDACDNLPAHLGDPPRGCRDWLDEEFSEFDPALLEQIDQMTVMEQSKLSTLLSVLGHGYRWNTIPALSNEFSLDSLALPRGLVEPWSCVSNALGQPMVGTLWSLLLCNWEIDGKDGGETYTREDLVYERMRVLHSFHGPPQDEQLRAFVLALVLTEGRGASIINGLIDLIESAAREDEEACIENFEGLIQALKSMSHVFMQLIKKRVLNPVTWLDNVQRPYVWGVKDQDGHPLEGPSGMQLGIMTCINTALDIRSDSPLAQSVLKSRMYLPTGHREFHAVFDAARPIIRDFVTKSQNTALRTGYNDALSVMALWKQMHHRRGAIYFKGDPNSKGMETSTGLVVTEGESLSTHFEKSMEQRIIETEQSKIVTDVAKYTPNEQEYLIELKECLNDNNVISGDERRLLNRMRDQLGLSPERALEVEASSNIKSSFRARELEYISELELCLSRTQGIDEKGRESLRELAEDLKLREERVAVLEAHVFSEIHQQTSDVDRQYLDEVEFCIRNDGAIKLDERRYLIRIRKKLGLSEERTYELEQYRLSHRTLGRD